MSQASHSPGRLARPSPQISSVGSAAKSDRRLPGERRPSPAEVLTKLREELNNSVRESGDRGNEAISQDGGDTLDSVFSLEEPEEIDPGSPHKKERARLVVESESEVEEEEEEESSKYDEEVKQKQPFHELEALSGQGSLNDNLLAFWKHTTISEDRTSESGWKTKQLAIVLPQLSLDPSDQTKKSIAKRTPTPPFRGRGLADYPDSVLRNQLMQMEQKDYLNRMRKAEESKLTDLENPGLGSTQGNPQVSKGPEVEDQEFPAARNNEEEGRPGSRAHYQLLMNRIQGLERENILLKSWIDPDSIHRGRPFFQVVYRFKGDDRVFFKPPSWTREDSVEGNRYILRGGSLSMKEKEYLKRSRNLAFVVFQSYALETVDGPTVAKGHRTETPPLPQS